MVVLNVVLNTDDDRKREEYEYSRAKVCLFLSVCLCVVSLLNRGKSEVLSLTFGLHFADDALDDCDDVVGLLHSPYPAVARTTETTETNVGTHQTRGGEDRLDEREY